MEYFSTRGDGIKISASQAVVNGLAPDGGLYVPSEFPHIGADELRDMLGDDYRGRAKRVISGFLPEFSAEEINALVTSAYGENYDDAAIAPTRFTDGSTGCLELWHGPTCAFKDMALQMLPHLLTASLKKCGEVRGVCILVATSGDTGKAALEGFADVPGTRILVFYPRDGVSDVQKLQMVTQSGENVMVSAVRGNFDDAQTGVKKIFGDRAFAAELAEKGWFLSSANSINWGRLLPQIAYYFSAYCDFVNSGRITLGDRLNFCVPTGNFGDILAGWYAGRMGLPVGKLICASNANNVLTDFIGSGTYDRNRPFYVTSSPSMDILVSSNLERLLYVFCGSSAEVSEYMRSLAADGKYRVSDGVREAVGREFAAGFCDDAATAEEIARVWNEKHYLIDTHTAVASRVLGQYRAQTGDGSAACIVSTASPYKFCDRVLSALGADADAPGPELISRLEELTGVPAPAPLKGLDGKKLRFGGCADKDGMRDVVADFLR